MQPPLKAILFDNDGTLVDSEGIHFQLWAEVLKSYGVFLSEEQYQRYYAGIPSEGNALDMIQRFGLRVSPSVLTNAKAAATQEFLLHQAFPLMPGALASVRFFKTRGLRVAIVTGASQYSVDATLRAYSLDNTFATVVSGADVVKGKPAPDCYLLAMKRLNVGPSECIAIEDTEHGVVAASSAGIACLGVPTAMSEHHDFSLASGVFPNLFEATQWVKTHRFFGESAHDSRPGFQENNMSAHDFSFDTIDGRPLALQDYQGRPILLVNTASECGFTPQYQGLQQLWERYRDRGLLVLGVPSNDFGAQEPGAEDAIQAFCSERYGVTFPMTRKQTVIGGDAHPLYRWIVEQTGEAGAPRWNFHKYLIGKDGELADMWPSKVEPLSPEVTKAIETSLFTR